MSENKFADPLAWRPRGATEKIPKEVFDARMALLPPSDAEKLKADFETRNDPIFKFIYFGGDMFGSLGANASSVMTRCAYVGVDEDTTLRLFKASAYGPQVDEKFIPEMLSEAMDFVAEFRVEMKMMGKHRAPHVKPMYLTHHIGDGNYK